MLTAVCWSRWLAPSPMEGQAILWRTTAVQAGGASVEYNVQLSRIVTVRYIFCSLLKLFVHGTIESKAVQR